MNTSSSADAALRALAEALRQLPAAAAVFDVAGRLVYANVRARALVAPQEHSGALDVVDHDGRAYDGDEWSLLRALAAGEPVDGEERLLRRSDGSEVVLRCSSSQILDEDRSVVAGVLMLADVTDDRRDRERLSTFERLLERTDDAIVGTDVDFCLTIWNAGAERLYGYTADEVLGRPAREVASYVGDESRHQLEGELLDDDRTRTAITAQRKDGTLVEVDIHAVAVRDGRGDVVGYLGVHRDMTARRRAEDERQAAQRRIETILESITDAFVAVDGQWRYTYVNDLALERMRARLGPELRREEVLGRGMWELFPSIVETELHERYQEAMRERRPVQFEAFIPGDDEWVDAHAYPSDGGLSIYYRDVSDRKRAEAAHDERARQRAVVAALGVRALGEADPQALMDEAVTAVARTLGVDLAGVAEILAGRDELLLRAGFGWRPGVVGRATGSAGEGSLVGYTAMIGQPVIAEDVSSDPRFTISPFLADHTPVSAVNVVLPGRHAPFGVLSAFALQPRRFSDDDVNFMQAVANVISVAFETAATETRLREVREAERRRIARDLHDEALQRLALALAEASRRSSHGSAGSEDELVGLLKGVGQQLRGAIYDLRLEEDEKQPLAERLRALVGVHAAMPGAPIELDVADATPDLPDRRGTAVLRIVGEALTNARRHAAAGRIVVRAFGDERTLRVEVADDGAGFDPDAQAPARESMGLRGMRERADLVGVELEVFTALGSGTTVSLELAVGSDDRTAEDPVRILLVEDHAAVREAIAATFEREPDFTVVGQAGSLAQARGMLAGVDVALLDLGLPDGFGPDLIAELRRRSPHAEAVVLSAALDRASLARAVESGAAGTIDKLAHLDEVVDAVRRLRAGQTLLAHDDVIELVAFERRRRRQETADRELIAHLTPREREVLQALAQGLDSQAIADRLHITLRTQRNHVANILAKLGVHSQLQALVFCLRYGVVKIR
ncbi:MAG TPA: PAS domain S-box protein [Solirubrobacteraceae bacterium]|jgi:PAS domain S-box-containing protein|nr:PAS domain S-box protein [Solirubrobacteraceae bacterium]